MEIDNIIKKAFDNPIKILKKLQAGLRCQTYLIESNNQKYIFQIYLDNTIYQAKKKYDLLNLVNIDTIPKAYKYFEGNDYAYLISEFKDGERLTNIFKEKEFSLEKIADKISYTISKVHSIKKENIFGWITDNTIYENRYLLDYIKSEYTRLAPNLNTLEDKLKDRILNRVEEAIKIIEKRSKNITTSCLCWYDINPDNILVSKFDKKYTLEGLIDPGGARYGIEEWDLAFIKMEVCRNEKEFETLLKSYSKYNNKNLDMELLKALTVIVELDDISIRILDNIKLPIPYESNFKEEIKLIENK